ncbi:MAG: glycosyltransferase family 39 protein [Defluviimonas sp.]|nr:glycosyltransferase family 39 protein [Defluviimonas sp.]
MRAPQPGQAGAHVGADDRAARHVLLLLAGYFALQLALRLAIGGALETDEAEMVLLTPGFRLGYGPQLPLYSWIQAASFALFGKTTFALAIVKNLMLFGTYALTFAALRPLLPLRLAVAGTLGLALLPDVFWEGQRATTHSVALMLMIAATLAAASRLLRCGRGRDYLLLGLVVGLGALSKYNYVLVPAGLGLAGLTLPPMRARLADRRMLGTAVVALAVVAAPLWWMLGHRELAFASGYKLTLGDAVVERLPWLGGLGDTASGMVAGLGLAALVAAGLRYGLRDRALPPEPLPEPGETFVRLLARAALIALAAFALAVVIAGATHVTSRWLLPIFLLAAPPLLIRALARARPAAFRTLLGVVAGLALLTIVGMAGARMWGPARGAVDFADVEAALARFSPETTPILADFYVGGNLALRNPDWQVASFLPTRPEPAPGAPVLVLTRGAPNLESVLGRSGWTEPERVQVLDSLDFEVPYRFDDSRTLALSARLVARP